MDDETAEIELLEQNLNKTRQIAQRMTTILTSFDGRLAKLEKSIYPLYTSTQKLNRRARHIELALLKIDEVTSNQEGVAVEEALILRGPQPDQLDTYKDALERLNASIAFKASDRDSLDTARLVETGAKKLVLLYTKLVAEGSSGSAPPPPTSSTTSLQPSALPSSLTSILYPLVSFLRTLPSPSTHPSHPASAAIYSTLKEAQKGYADMRGNWCKKCLEGQAKRVLDRADNIDSVLSGRELGSWVSSVISFAEAEYNNLTDLAPLASPQLLSQAYSTLLNPLLSLFSSTLSSLIALIKRSLYKYSFLALSAYDALSALQPRWENLLSWRSESFSLANPMLRGAAATAPGGGNELRDGMNQLRAVCLRSFPELLADIKIAAMAPGGKSATLGPGGEMSTSVVDIALTTVKYLKRLPDVQSAAGTALLVLGDGNWKMGEGLQVKKAQSKLGEGDEEVIIEHFVYDLITTLISTLVTMSKTNRRASMGSVFLLNNMTYVRSHLILSPPSLEVTSLLSRQTQEAINSGWRSAKAGYFDSNFSPLMQALSDDGPSGSSSKSSGVGGVGLGGGGGGSSKAVTKEKFTRFFDLLEEVIERHKLAHVLEEDREGREVLSEEVVKLVVMSLRRFVQRYAPAGGGGKDGFSKNPQKYIKMSPEEVEVQIRNIYR